MGSIRLDAGAKPVGERVRARRFEEPDHLRRRHAERLEIAIGKLGMARFLVGLLAGELREIRSSRCLQPLGAAAEQPGCPPGEDVVPHQPADVAGQRVRPGRGCVFGLGKPGRDGTLDQARSEGRAFGRQLRDRERDQRRGAARGLPAATIRHRDQQHLRGDLNALRLKRIRHRLPLSPSPGGSAAWPSARARQPNLRSRDRGVKRTLPMAEVSRSRPPRGIGRSD